MNLSRSQVAKKPIREIAGNIIKVAGEPDDLRCYLESLRYEKLRILVALMYFGRERARRSFQGVLNDDIKGCSDKQKAIGMLMGKQPKLRKLLEFGIRKFDETSLDEFARLAQAEA